MSDFEFKLNESIVRYCGGEMIERYVDSVTKYKYFIETNNKVEILLSEAFFDWHEYFYSPIIDSIKRNKMIKKTKITQDAAFFYVADKIFLEGIFDIDTATKKSIKELKNK